MFIEKSTFIQYISWENIFFRVCHLAVFALKEMPLHYSVDCSVVLLRTSFYLII